jgi:Protein of unknown function (DUF3105)
VPRQRLRPTRRQAGASQPTRQDAPAHSARVASGPRKPKPQWRQTIDSFGGFLTVGAIIGAILIVVAIFVVEAGKGSSATSRDVSTKPEIGTQVDATDPATDRLHISDPNSLQIPDGQPPVRGPHYAVPQSVGVYDQPVPDGNAIHALEHGIVWISYNPTLLDADGVKALRDLGKQYGNDTIVAPRPLDSTAIAAASWGYRMDLDKFDKAQLEDFIKTNRNRSPEPFIR